jgi:hypothetical protein
MLGYQALYRRVQMARGELRVSLDHRQRPPPTNLLDGQPVHSGQHT